MSVPVSAGLSSRTYQRSTGGAFFGALSGASARTMIVPGLTSTTRSLGPACLLSRSEKRLDWLSSGPDTTFLVWVLSRYHVPLVVAVFGLRAGHCSASSTASNRLRPVATV